MRTSFFVATIALVFVTACEGGDGGATPRPDAGFDAEVDAGLEHCNGLDDDGDGLVDEDGARGCWAYAAADFECISGVCELVSCLSGFADCNGSFSDGCEEHLASSVDHCGACNVPCAGKCMGGHCVTLDAHRFGGPGADAVIDVATTGTGVAILASNTAGYAVLGSPYSIVIPSADSGGAGFVWTLDSNGWSGVHAVPATSTNSASLHSISVDGAGNIYVGGRFVDSVSFGEQTLDGVAKSSDPFVVGFDEVLTPKWIANPLAAESSIDWGTTVDVESGASGVWAGVRYYHDYPYFNPCEGRFSHYSSEGAVLSAFEFESSFNVELHAIGVGSDFVAGGGRFDGSLQSGDDYLYEPPPDYDAFLLSAQDDGATGNWVRKPSGMDNLTTTIVEVSSTNQICAWEVGGAAHRLSGWSAEGIEAWSLEAPGVWVTDVAPATDGFWVVGGYDDGARFGDMAFARRGAGRRPFLAKVSFEGETGLLIDFAADLGEAVFLAVTEVSDGRVFIGGSFTGSVEVGGKTLTAKDADGLFLVVTPL